MFWQVIQLIIRHSLTGVGLLIVNKGLLSADDNDKLVGAIMVVLGIVHSIYNKWKLSDKNPPTTPPSPGPRIPVMLFAVCLPIAAAISLGVAGCRTTPQAATYQAAGTTVVTVDTAMNLWGAYVAANHPSTNQEKAVQSAYDKYQSAMAIACDAGALYASTGGTNATAQAALNQAIANSSTELVDLESLITSFGVKLQ